MKFTRRRQWGQNARTNHRWHVRRDSASSKSKTMATTQKQDRSRKAKKTGRGAEKSGHSNN